MLFDIGLHNIFFEYVSSVKKKKKKQMGLHQTKSFCTAKGTITKMKWLSTEWGEICKQYK